MQRESSFTLTHVSRSSAFDSVRMLHTQPPDILASILDSIEPASPDRRKWKRCIGRFAVAHRLLLPMCRKWLFRCIELPSPSSLNTSATPSNMMYRPVPALGASCVRHLSISLGWAWKEPFDQWEWSRDADNAQMRELLACTELTSVTIQWPGGAFPEERLRQWEEILEYRTFRAERNGLLCNYPHDLRLTKVEMVQLWPVSKGRTFRDAIRIPNMASGL